MSSITLHNLATVFGPHSPLTEAAQQCDKLSGPARARARADREKADNGVLEAEDLLVAHDPLFPGHLRSSAKALGKLFAPVRADADVPRVDLTATFPTAAYDQRSTTVDINSLPAAPYTTGRYAEMVQVLAQHQGQDHTIHRQSIRDLISASPLFVARYGDLAQRFLDEEMAPTVTRRRPAPETRVPVYDQDNISVTAVVTYAPNPRERDRPLPGSIKVSYDLDLPAGWSARRTGDGPTLRPHQVRIGGYPDGDATSKGSAGFVVYDDALNEKAIIVVKTDPTMWHASWWNGSV